jgi:hypothetical protein
MICMEIANFFWHGKLTKYEYMCIKSFVNNGFIVNLWCYDDNIGEYPDGININDARDILPIEHLLLYEQGGRKQSLAAFSDVFRFNVIHKFNGQWWFDTDCVCLKDQNAFNSLKENKKMVLGYEDSNYINGAVICVNQSEISLELINKQTERLNKGKLAWGDIGPRLITDFCNQSNLMSEILDTNYFYPIHWSNMEDFFNEKLTNDIIEKCNNSYVCHLWNEIFKLKNIDKIKMPPKNCFMNILFEYNGVSWK